MAERRVGLRADLSGAGYLSGGRDVRGQVFFNLDLQLVPGNSQCLADATITHRFARTILAGDGISSGGTAYV